MSLPHFCYSSLYWLSDDCFLFVISSSLFHFYITLLTLVIVNVDVVFTDRRGYFQTLKHAQCGSCVVCLQVPYLLQLWAPPLQQRYHPFKCSCLGWWFSMIATFGHSCRNHLMCRLSNLSSDCRGFVIYVSTFYSVSSALIQCTASALRQRPFIMSCRQCWCDEVLL